MSVENFEVIDVISIDLNGNAVLTISDHLEWDDNKEHLLILQNKINAYLNAIESGNLYENYPNARGRNIIINVVAMHDPDSSARTFLERIEAMLKSAGYDFACVAAKNDT